MATSTIRASLLLRSATFTSPATYSRPLFAASPAATRPYSSAFNTGPSPPRLPADQQAEFERLQRTANTQEGFNPSATPEHFTTIATPATAAATATETTTAEDTSFAPLRKGAPPEFEGDTNPKTGEVGGPKNEPLRWGAGGDYSFNGRVTDF